MADKTALKTTPIVLASSSPRRSEILVMLGIDHTICIPDMNEVNPPIEPGPLVIYLSKRKAEVAAGTVGGELILSADTIVFHDGIVMGKPCSRDEALRMLQRLSGEWHRVHTGLTLLAPSTGLYVSGEEITSVKFRDLEQREIEDYISTGEPFDKAGGYGIQGRGSALVERIDGCYFNVVGLPVVKLLSMLRELGYRYGFPGLYARD